MVYSVKKEFDGAFCSVFRGNISVFLCVSLFFLCILSFLLTVVVVRGVVIKIKTSFMNFAQLSYLCQ